MSSATTSSSGHGPTRETARVRHGDGGPPPSLAIVEAIAHLAGVDPTELAAEGIVLYDHVDPDALDALVAGRSPGVVDVSLAVAGYDVRVDADAVVVRRRA